MKNLTATLIDLNNTFASVPAILSDIEVASMKGQTVVQVAALPSIVFEKLGYEVTQSVDRWIISWSDPKKPCTKYFEKKSAWNMKSLIGKFQPIRELCLMLEAEANEAALFGFKQAQILIPSSIDKVDLRNYIVKAYPTDDVEIIKDQLVINWDPDKDYL